LTIEADSKTQSNGIHNQSLPTVDRHRSLIALDGSKLTPAMLSTAVAKCARFASRVDILLVNSAKAPTYVLHKLLIGLEHAGIDYRLASGSGALGDELTQYVRRFLGITMIMVTTLPALGEDWEAKVADLRYQGYRVTTLNEPQIP
jgi:hypothetical protein